jgi:hypothetical protein
VPTLGAWRGTLLIINVTYILDMASLNPQIIPSKFQKEKRKRSEALRTFTGVWTRVAFSRLNPERLSLNNS